MAAEYFLYTTLYNNTLVERSKSSFAPLPPDTGEIFIDYFIPTNQPLYYYRESGGTIVFSDETIIEEYLKGTASPPDGNTIVDYDVFTGYTANTIGVTDSRKFFAGKSSNQNLLGSQGPITNWDSGATYNNSEFYSWNELTGELTFLKAGIYEISFDLVVFDTSGSNRSQARSYLQEDTGSGFTNIPYTRKEYYNRQSDYGASGSVNITREFNIGDKIRPTAWQTQGTDTLTIIGDSTSLSVIKSEVGMNTTKYILTGGSAVTLNFIEKVSGATGNLGQFTTNGNLEDTGTTVDELIASKGATNVFYGYSKTAANGLQDEGFNLNVTRVSTGTYDYTFIEPASDANYGVFAQPFGTTTDTNSMISNVTTTGFRVELGEGDNSASPDVLVDTDHAVGIFGVPVSGFSGVSVVSFKTFTGYTASTDTRLDSIETDVGNNTSDITDLQNDKLDITEFNSYTGTTATLIGTKLDETIFNTFTGTTLPANYYNKTEINSYTGVTDTLIGTKYDKSGGTITGNVQIDDNLVVSGETYLSGITEVQQDVSYGTPRPTSLPSTNDTFNNVFVYGTGGPDLSNVTSWVFNWDLPNDGLYSFALNTDDGVPSYYVNLLPSTTQTFNQTNPDLTLSGTGITDLDGNYWINKIGSDIVLVSKTEDFAIYLTNDSSGYNPPVFNSTLVSVDDDKKTLNTGINPHLYGTEFQFVEDLTDSTTSSTSPQTKLTLTTNDLPSGRYKISVNWGWTHTSASNSAIFDVQLNGTTMNGISQEEPKDTTNRKYEHRVFYHVLSGINDITLRYWNENSSTTIFDTNIELIRVE